jgi:peptide subunit release factor 1 (eRF1)
MITAETINRIARFRGNGLPVISLYARVPEEGHGRQRVITIEVDHLLHEIRPFAEDHKLGHDAMESVRGDIKRITEAVGEDRWSPGGIALFSCSGRDFFEEVPLPRGVRERVVVDENPLIRPMLAVLDEFHRSCVAVVDRQVAHTWELYGDDLRETGSLSTPGDPGRDQDKAREIVKRHYKAVATMLDRMHRDDRFELLIIGGHHGEVPDFLGFLSHDLRGCVAGTFTLDDDSRNRFAEIKDKATAIVDQHERHEEQQSVADLVETSEAHGLAVLGLTRCLWAGTVGAVRELLVQDDVAVPGVVCDHDRWLAGGGNTCPLCGRPLRHVPDVIDELVEMIIDDGSSVEHVTADTALKRHLAGATLRFPLPPAPAELAAS